MRIISDFLLSTCAVLILATAANAQAATNSEGATFVQGAARVPAIIVGSAAKSVWVVTKFSAEHAAKPVAKAVFVKAAPSIGKYALRKSAKYVVPIALKLSVL